ncbi:oligosaccharide flippase family protein [Bradyrhizobium sp. PRIMUS42]|uniref:oligosaccharide flippase family protein n=1 Tax=Bradyrhizobium sp. PRIMUS42 TaxID=2908926 RepID=UPI001FF2C6A7|nr:oligosaccharide flippase family protein [Bradyrhizobium sp. PRIMUS42]MCJ9729717.1 oligosaccharide flippase family protein [Bradyrhizobium sp. PRIMUS42]
MTEAVTSTGQVSRAIGWNIALTIVSIVVQVAVTMSLGRLLTSADYGVFAFANSIIVFSSHLSQRGLSGAMLKQGALTPADVGNSYVVCVSLVALISTLIGAVVLSLKFFGARFEPQSDILLFLLLPLSIQLLSTPAATILQRNFAVVRANIFQVCGMVVGNGVVACWFAYSGWGAWSLAYGAFAAAVITGALNVMGGWSAVAFEWSYRRYTQLLSDAIAMNGLRALDVAWLQAPILFFGVFATIANAGLYQRMQFFADLLLQMTVWRVGTVLYTAMAVERNEATIGNKQYRSVFRVLVTLTLPIIAFVWTAAEPMIGFLLGPAWLDGAWTFRILIIAFGLYTINQAGFWTLELSGRFVPRYASAGCALVSVVLSLLLVPIDASFGYGFAPLCSMLVTAFVLQYALGERLSDVRTILVSLRGGVVLAVGVTLGAFLGALLGREIGAVTPLELLLVQAALAGGGVVCIVPIVLSFAELSTIRELLLHRFPQSKRYLELIALYRFLRRA